MSVPENTAGPRAVHVSFLSCPSTRLSIIYAMIGWTLLSCTITVLHAGTYRDGTMALWPVLDELFPRCPEADSGTSDFPN
jgi:hypothetical protein